MTEKPSYDIEFDEELDALLSEAAQSQLIPSAALLARIAADAAEVQEAALRPAPQLREVTPSWRVWLSEIGGFPALGGLAMSALVGGYIGFANPQMTFSVQSLAGLTTGTEAEVEDPFSTPLLGDLDWIGEG